jgi:hypothetical protein
MSGCIEADIAGFAGELADEVESFAEPLADGAHRRGHCGSGALPRLGKPETPRRVRSHLHRPRRVGARITAEICRRSRTSRRLSGTLRASHITTSGSFLIHQRPLSRRTVYDYLAATQPVAADVTLLSVADRLAARGEGPLASPEMVEAHLDLAREMLRDALAWHRDGPPQPPIGGDDLKAELGMTPGPEMGRVLEELRAATFAGEVRDRAEALELARQLQ